MTVTELCARVIIVKELARALLQWQPVTDPLILELTTAFEACQKRLITASRVARNPGGYFSEASVRQHLLIFHEALGEMRGLVKALEAIRRHSADAALALNSAHEKRAA